MTRQIDSLPSLRALREASALAWQMAIDTCYVGQTDEIDGPRQAECQAAADSAMAFWDDALEAAEAGRMADAIASLDDAKTLAGVWGDSSHEREALELLASPAEGGAR